MILEAGCWARLTIGKKCFVQLHDGVYPVCAHPDSTAVACPVMCVRNRVRREVERALDARFGSSRCRSLSDVVTVKV